MFLSVGPGRPWGHLGTTSKRREFCESPCGREGFIFLGRWTRKIGSGSKTFSRGREAREEGGMAERGVAVQTFRLSLSVWSIVAAAAPRGGVALNLEAVKNVMLMPGRICVLSPSSRCHSEDCKSDDDESAACCGYESHAEQNLIGA